jgi:CDP-diglyceride synthetase
VNTELSLRLKTAGILIGLLASVGGLSLYFCFFKWLLFDIGILAIGLAAYEYASFSSAGSSGARVGVLSRTTIFLILILPTLAVTYGATILGICQTSALDSSLITLALLGYLIGVICLGFLMLRVREGTIALILSAFGERMIALLFFGFCASFLLIIAASEDAFLDIVWIVSVVAVADSVAYFCGKRFGRTPFATLVSPNKTWEGAGAGLVCAALTGGLLSGIIGSGFSLTFGSLLGLVVAGSSQVGDLTKSLLKRIHGVKDSGTLLPGHGGVLDRIDGHIAAAPLYYLLHEWLTW